MGSILFIDWIIWVVYTAVIILLFWIYRKGKSENHYRFFISGLIIKILGGLVFALIYIYYYKFGDTFLYHRGASVLADTMVSDPLSYFRLLASSNNNLPADLHEFTTSIDYSRTFEEWFMVKLISPLSFLAFNSYLVLTLFMSIISFFGSWKLFQVFRDIMPKKENLCFYAVFLLPTVVFWGGGIMKDTITLAAINFIIYYLYFGIFKNNFNPFNIILVFFLGFIIYQLKAYIIIAFLPGIVYAIYVHLKQKIRNVILRLILGPVILLGLIGLSFIGIQTLSESSSKYNSENLTYQVKGFHSWHSDLGGSSYSLGEVEYTPLGIVSKIPAALNVTYFRPYLWEASSAVVLVTAVESSIVLALFVYALFKSKRNFFRYLLEKPLLIGFFIYCLIFGFAVGFTSYNFGALARYKIPVLSLFIFLLLYLIYRSKQKAQLDKS